MLAEESVLDKVTLWVYDVDYGVCVPLVTGCKDCYFIVLIDASQALLGVWSCEEATAV